MLGTFSCLGCIDCTKHHQRGRRRVSPGNMHLTSQVNWVLRALLEEKKIARATHNIFAYRYVDASKGIQVSSIPFTPNGKMPALPLCWLVMHPHGVFGPPLASRRRRVLGVQLDVLHRCRAGIVPENLDPLLIHETNVGMAVADNDDDGESGAGAKLASLLELMGANNVLVVVSRWYGGIHLGPDRFKYIAQAARAVLESGGYCKPPKSTRPTSKEATGLRKSRRSSMCTPLALRTSLFATHSPLSASTAMRDALRTAVKGVPATHNSPRAIYMIYSTYFDILLILRDFYRIEFESHEYHYIPIFESTRYA
eukprot:scaffold39169_cov36-Tisochrysis_lutea.AAC.3